MYSVDLKKDWAKRGAHAAQALALRERLRCASEATLRNSIRLSSSQAAVRLI
jgi:hypothetical protein